jgi:hypothetical protein
MDPKMLFYIGIILGLIGGVVLTLLFVKVKSLFSSSEVRRLSREKKSLEKRLQEKDRYIDEMMGHAEKLAHNFSTKKLSDRKDS